MAQCIYFESYFQWRPSKREFTPENCPEWTITEEWSVDSTIIQKIVLEKEEYLEGYNYYVDLEIVPVFRKCDQKIFRSERMPLSNIKIVIHGHEYLKLGTYPRIVDNITKDPDNMYQYKITLTPIFPFKDEIFRKPGKRTKIDLLKGLKKFWNDISLLKNDQFCDIIIYSEDKCIKAHRNIMSARSRMFNKLLHGEEKDEEVQSCFEIIPKGNDITNDDDSLNDNDNINDDSLNDDNINDNSLNDNDNMNDDSINNRDTINVKKEEETEDTNCLKVKLEINEDKCRKTAVDEYRQVSADDYGNSITNDNLKNITTNYDCENGNDSSNAVVGDDLRNSTDGDDSRNTAVTDSFGNSTNKNDSEKGDEDYEHSATNDDFGANAECENADRDEYSNYAVSDSTNAVANNDLGNSASNDDSKSAVDNDLKDSDAAANDESESAGSDISKNDAAGNYKNVGGKFRNNFKNSTEDDSANSDNSRSDDDNYYNDSDSDIDYYYDDTENDCYSIDTYAEKDNEDQRRFETKPFSLLKDNNTSISIFPKKDEGQISIEAEKHNVDNGTSTILAEGLKNIQHRLNLDYELTDDNGSAISPSEYNNNVSLVGAKPELSCYAPTSTEGNKTKNGLWAQPRIFTDIKPEISTSCNNIVNIKLRKINASVFEDFIDFIYSGNYKTFDIENAKDLLLAARNYGVCDLEYKCIIYLQSQISVETICDIYSFACEHKCEKLQIHVLDYAKNKIVGSMRRNIPFLQIEQANDETDEVLDFDMRKWLEIMRDHPIYFNDILEFKKGKKIRDVFKEVYPDISFEEDILTVCTELLEDILNILCGKLDNSND